MADTYTALLRLVQMATGSDPTAWGDNATATFQAIEQAVAGSVSISLTASDHVLTTANNASDEARNAALILTGTPGALRNLTVPNSSKIYLVFNNTDSDVVLATAVPTTSATLHSGQAAWVYCDGSNNVTPYFLPAKLGWSTLSQLHSDKSL